MSVQIPRRRSLLLTLACLAAIGSPHVGADDPHGDDAMRSAMRRLADSVTIEIPSGADPELLVEPVFRYSDQPRRIVDATLWVWTVNGRPAAMQKVEAVERPEGPGWTVCLASFTPELLNVEWTGGQQLDCTQPGAAFQALSQPPELNAAAIRPLHTRQVARRFAARIVNDPEQKTVEQMRLLARPIFEYSHPETGLLAGAIFGFASNGTNPDAYLVLEANQREEGQADWRYAWVRMTSGGVTGLLDNEPVWSCDWVRPQSVPRENWMFFRLTREP